MRNTMCNVMSHINIATRLRNAERIVAQLVRHTLWRNSSTILSYWPLPEEPNIATMHHYTLEKGKRVALAHPLHPAEYRIVPAKNALSQRSAASPSTIAAAMTTWQVLPLTALRRATLLLIPGLAFDRRGYRLGRGSGWYNQLLHYALSPTVTVGICYTQQLLTMLPATSHDKRMKWLCHERALLSTLD